MNTSPRKRYGAALIRHFVLISLFFPAFYSHFKNVYYQDVSFIGIIALMLTIHFLFKCRLDFRKHRFSVITLIAVLLIYTVTALVNFKRYPVMYWYTELINIVIAVVFFLCLLLVRKETDYVSDSCIRFCMVAMTVHNVAAIIYRLTGGSRFFMKALDYEATKISPENPTFSWLYYDASEYALILLLTMAFFITYKSLFKTPYLYWAAQALTIICMLLTNVSIYYLAALLIFAGDLIQSLAEKKERLQNILSYLYLPAIFLYGCGIFLLTRVVEAFRIKAAIWNGTWDMLKLSPEGIYVCFGALYYPIPELDITVLQSQNTFLNHMLRYSLGVGIVFTLLIATIFILSFLKKPSLRSLCILLAALLPILLDFGLQILHLPYVLFLMYTIFYRKGEKDYAQ